MVRVALAVMLVLGIMSLVNHSLDARTRWGDTRTVFVARDHVDLGDVVNDDDVTVETWPVAVVPDGAVDASPAGRTAVAAIERGEAVVAARLAPDGLRGVAALVPDGWRAIAVPVGPAMVTLSVGDHVDLIAGFDASGSDGGGAPAFVIARDALVVAVDEEAVTVAVRDTDAARVAFAVVAGTVVPALRPT
jgi:Flp pilus assembly protein CpaB